MEDSTERWSRTNKVQNIQCGMWPKGGRERGKRAEVGKGGAGGVFNPKGPNGIEDQLCLRESWTL